LLKTKKIGADANFEVGELLNISSASAIRFVERFSSTGLSNSLKKMMKLIPSTRLITFCNFNRSLR
jgi:hypothetical protein